MGTADRADGATETIEIHATLEAWRARGADRVNPTRFRFIDALARRAAGHEGDVRRVLDERLAALIADYSAQVQRAEANAAVTDSNAGQSPYISAERIGTQSAPHRSALAELIDLLTSRARAVTESADSAARDAAHSHRQGRSPDLPMLDYFRETWSRFSTEKQLRKSLEQVPDNAGPLNSNSLMHRALSLMRELSPGYLQQFLSYAEALSWMEQLAGPVAGANTGAPAAPVSQVPRTGSAKKSARGKAR